MNDTFLTPISVGRENGLKVSCDPNNTWHQPTSERDMERDFEKIIQEYEKANMKLELIMVIFPFKVCHSYLLFKTYQHVKINR
jgi:hypothetical protein